MSPIDFSNDFLWHMHAPWKTYSIFSEPKTKTTPNAHCIGEEGHIYQDTWKNDIVILLLQEPKINSNTYETRKDYTWYFSGAPMEDIQPHGVAIVVV